MHDLISQLNVALAGRYRVERELGRGGMATVFRADDLRHRRPVAIKVLDSELGAIIGRERFLREIEIAAGLNHAHILPLYDSGAADGLLYFVMPLAEGESLRHRLKREKQLPVAEATRVAREVADALDYAHRQGIVHRDIKPENILLQEQHAVVADFGIARAVGAAGAQKLTRTGVVICTPAYMSPEQAAGAPDLDGRSDVYALGCVLYEMLAGQPPFTGPDETLSHQHLNVAARPVTDLRPAVPARIAQAIGRALAKAPADRFRTGSEFAAAIAAADGPAPVPVPAPARWRWPVIVAVSAVAILLLAIGLSRIIRGGDRKPQIANKSWIMVAEFDGPPADSTAVEAIRDLVTAALDESQIVATVPRDQIKLALQSAGKPPSTRVDADVAREIAYRSAVKAVLEGHIGRLGQGYSIVLRLVDVDSARVLASLSDAARDAAALIPTVGRIAKKLRASLGEHQSALQATREISLSITPSFEAYKALIQARVHLFGGEDRAAITWFRSALALDPDFSSAWGGMGYAFGNLGEPDSSLAAFQNALAHPERMPARGKLFAEIQIALLNGDLERTLALSVQLVQLAPESWTARNNHSVFLSYAGRLEEALASARTAERVSAFGATQQVFGNQFLYLLWLGRADTALALIPKLKGAMAQEAPMDVAAAAGRWGAAESLATILWHASSTDDDVRGLAANVLAAVQSSRGMVRAADQTLHRAQSVGEASHRTLGANRARWSRLRLALFSRGVATAPGSPGSWDNTTAGLVTHGAWAAAEGDTTLARQLLATIRKRPAIDLARQGFGPQVLEGWIAARTGRWEEVLHVLGPLAAQGEARGYALFQSAPLVRWLVAEAHERLGHPDSAAACFELAIAPMPRGGTDANQIRMASAFGHHRLALLASRAGRMDEARRHWESFSKTFTDPDPEMMPLLVEARAVSALAR